MKKFKTVDEYIENAPNEVKDKLIELRKLIMESAPQAREGMRYGMPGYKVNKKPLPYLAGWKDHIPLYPTSSKVEQSIPELAKFRTGKGTLQFPIDQALPMDLIRSLVKLRIEETK